MMSDLIVVVQIDGQWLFFDFGVFYFFYVIFYWCNIGIGVFIFVLKDVIVIVIQFVLFEVFLLKCKVVFVFDVDGIFEGDVIVEYDGY